MSSESQPAANPTLETSEEEFVVSPFKELPRREATVRLCLPGLDVAAHRLEMGTTLPLVDTLVQGLSQTPHVKELELLTISGERHQEYFLTPRLDSVPSRSTQQDFSAFTTDHARIPDSTTDKLAGVAAKTLPEEIGVEICDVDLAPVRMWPVTTGRVLLDNNGALRQPHFDRNDPYIQTVSQLASTGFPFVVQVIVGTGRNAEYVLTLRYAIIHPAYAIASGSDESLHLLDPKQHPIEDVWHNAGLTTNYDLPIREFARPGRRRQYSRNQFIKSLSRRRHDPRLEKRSYMQRSDSQAALDLYTGTTEYRALFHGRPSAPTLYDNLDLHARIPVNGFTLQQFGSLVALYYDVSPWLRIPERAGPAITTRAVIRTAPGTEQANGTTSVTPSEHDSGRTVNTGSEGHDQLLVFAVEYFRGQGDEAWIEAQDGSSIPDGGRRTADGVERTIEVEFSSLSKPANPLINYARAMHADQPVDFVVTSEPKARRLSESLRAPWKTVTDHGVALHNLTATVSLPSEQLPVLPSNESESKWYLETDGTLSLRDSSGAVLAEGAASESVGTFEYETPRYDDSDGAHRIVTPEGVTKATYQTRSQLLAEWTLVHAPFVPGDLHCLANVAIHYQSGDELIELDTQAGWDRSAETKMERYEGGLREFVETYTREQDGESMLYTTFQDHVQALFEARSRHDVPNATYIGHARPDSLAVDDPGVTVRQIRDRALLYPPGLVSPDLPFVEEDGDREGSEDESAADEETNSDEDE